MPQDNKIFDISKPVATPATRPVISSGPPAPDPMVKPATKVSVSVLDESPEPKEIAPTEPTPSLPAAQPEPPVPVNISQAPDTPVQPAGVDAAPPEVEPQIDNISVNTPPPQASMEEVVPVEASGNGAITPALPGAPPSDFSNVPKFGELQSKIDAHPLFSGAKEHRVKVRRLPGFVKPLSIILVLLVVAYLAVDAGVVRGASHLPFHVFKQKTASPVPAISQPQVSAQNQLPSTTTPQATQTPAATSASSSDVSTPYGQIINKFILAMRNKDKPTADSLESNALKTSTRKQMKTDSFYDACESSGSFCMGLFAGSFVDASKTTTKDYKAQDGTAGKEITYTVTANGNSSTSLIIAAVPSGSSWLIDYVDASGGN